MQGDFLPIAGRKERKKTTSSSLLSAFSSCFSFFFFYCCHFHLCWAPRVWFATRTSRGDGRAGVQGGACATATARTPCRVRSRRVLHRHQVISPPGENARTLIGREEPSRHHLIQHPASKHNEGKQKKTEERKEREVREGRKRNDVVDKKARHYNATVWVAGPWRSRRKS